MSEPKTEGCTFGFIECAAEFFCVEVCISLLCLGNGRGLAKEPGVVNVGDDFYCGKFISDLLEYWVLGECE